MKRWLKDLESFWTKSNECSKVIVPEINAISNQDGEATESNCRVSNSSYPKAKKKKYDESYTSLRFVDSDAFLYVWYVVDYFPIT